MLVMVLLILNLLLLVYVWFFKRDAYRLETLKVGGRANMQMAKELYRSDVYVQQQKATLEQYLASIEQATPQADTTTPAVVDTTTTPVVTQ